MPDIGPAPQPVSPPRSGSDIEAGRINVLSGVLFGALVVLIVGVGVFYAWRAWFDPTEGNGSSAVVSESTNVQIDVEDSEEVYSNDVHGFTLHVPEGWASEPEAESSELIASFAPAEHDKRLESPTFIELRTPGEGLAAFSNEDGAGDAPADTEKYFVFEEQDKETIGSNTFYVYTKAHAMFGGTQYFYVLETDAGVISFEGHDTVQSVLLTMLRSLDFGDEGEAVAGLDDSDVLYTRATHDGGFEVIGVESDGSSEKVHLSVSSENGRVHDADVDDERKRLAYVTDQSIFVRDLSTGEEEEVANGTESESSFVYTSVEFSPEGRYVAGRLEYEEAPARPYIFNLEAGEFKADDVSQPPEQVDWVDAKTLLLVYPEGAQYLDGIELYDVETNEHTAFDEEYWTGSPRPYRGAVNHAGTWLAVVGTTRQDDAPDADERVNVWLFNMKSGQREETKDLIVSPHTWDRIESGLFGIAWTPDDSRIAVSLGGDVWLADAEDLESFEPNQVQADRGRVEGVLPSGELVLMQRLYADSREPALGRMKLMNSEAESELYVSEPRDWVSALR